MDSSQSKQIRWERSKIHYYNLCNLLWFADNHCTQCCSYYKYRWWALDWQDMCWCKWSQIVVDSPINNLCSRLNLSILCNWNDKLCILGELYQRSNPLDKDLYRSRWRGKYCWGNLNRLFGLYRSCSCCYRAGTPGKLKRNRQDKDWHKYSWNLSGSSLFGRWSREILWNKSGRGIGTKGMKLNLSNMLRGMLTHTHCSAANS